MQTMANFIRIVFVIAVIKSYLVSCELQCTDEDGHPIDWYVAYKVPLLNKETDYLLRHGLAYMYMTSENDTEWILSSKGINDSRSILGATLAPLFEENPANYLYGLYNDEPPTARAGSIYGHTKGVIIANENGGIWLTHSAPRFPNVPEAGTNYSYPQTAVRFGQSFICISLSKEAVDSVGTQLTYNRPKVYAQNVPDYLKDEFPTLVSALNGAYVREAPWFNKNNISSRSGTVFTSYAKSGRFGKELYADWLAPDLNTGLQVETWANGRGELPSDCHKEYHVMDVTSLNFTIGLKSIQFTTSQDHSKWAAGITRKVICIGDINRMEAQLGRGGGTICLKNENVWKKYSKAVVDVQPCPHSKKN